MHYSFDTEDAERYGVEEAIVLHNLKHWINKNEANKRHCFEGRFWTYNSADAYQKLFPFWTAKQIRRILTSLETKGAIITGNFNMSGYDRTKWYGLSDEVLAQKGKCIFPNGQMDVTKRANAFSQTGTPIPDSNTDSKPNDNNTPDNSSSPMVNYDQKEAAPKKEKLAVGEAVLMTEEEIKKLHAEHGAEKTNWMIQKLNNYKLASGKKYKNDYRAILSWVLDEAKKNFKPGVDNSADAKRRREAGL